MLHRCCRVSEGLVVARPDEKQALMMIMLRLLHLYDSQLFDSLSVPWWLMRAVNGSDDGDGESGADDRGVEDDD